MIMSMYYFGVMLDHYRQRFQAARTERERLFLAEQIEYYERKYQEVNN